MPPDLTEYELGLRNDIEEHNLLVASWLDDLGRGQKEFEDKVLFYNSEKILNRGNRDKRILHHFQHENKKMF